MGIAQVLRGFGNGVGDIFKFTNGNTAQAVYVVGDDGGPIGSTGSPTYIPPSGGIVDTTGVVLMPAPGAGKVNTLSKMTVTNGSATGTEIELRNGASGPVLWRGYSPANSSQNFTPNVSASPNALIEFAALTTASKLYVTNLSGFVS